MFKRPTSGNLDLFRPDNSYAYWSTLVQFITCRLFGTPSPGAMLLSWEDTSLKCVSYHNYFQVPSRTRQNGRHFPDDIFKSIFLNKNCCILMKISLNFVPRGPISNIPALAQIKVLRRSGDKPFLNQWWPSLVIHICATRPQWVEKNY